MRKRIDDSIYNMGSNIRTARLRADLTQEKLAEILGVTNQYLSELERGLVGTSIPTLVKICNSLNVSADFILFGKGDGSDNVNPTLIERIQRLPKHKADMVERNLNLFFEAMDMEPERQSYK